MTQLEKAAQQELTAEIKAVASAEGQPVELVMERVASGQIVIPANTNRAGRSRGHRQGSSHQDQCFHRLFHEPSADIAMEVEKARIAEKYGADTLMDLSVGGDIPGIRRAVMDGHHPACRHGAPIRGFCTGHRAIRLRGEDARRTAFRGDREAVRRKGSASWPSTAASTGRPWRCSGSSTTATAASCRKGGSYLVAWMEHNNMENPLYEHFDRVVEILKQVRLRC